MAGAGALPGRVAAEAKRRGWRVTAFTFDEAPGLVETADAVIPSTIAEVQAVLSALSHLHIEATVFAGKFPKARLFSHADDTDEAGRRMGRGGLSDSALAETVVATFAALGAKVLDQREFLAPWLLGAGTLTARAPSLAEWAEIREGFRLARQLATYGIGQTIVRSLGVNVAVEAVEGTDETIRRGTRLAGPGAVVVKAVAPDHDYRFDTPTVGLMTLQAMAEGGASALAVESGKLLLLDRDDVVRLADRAGIALVGTDGEG